MNINKYGFLTNSQVQKSPDQILKQNARLEKWRVMLQNWQSVTQGNQRKLKRRTRKGIPAGLRGRIWINLSGTQRVQTSHPEGHYNFLLNQSVDIPASSVIEADLKRTFNDNIFFRDQQGLQRLSRLLRAYSLFDPQVGYMQGMSYIAALFLLFLSEQEAFWLLATVMTEYGMRKCFIQKMPRVYSSFYISNALLRHNIPRLYSHLAQIGVTPTMFATQWFMTGYTINFHINFVVRIWDSFFLQGNKIHFRVYLGIMKILKSVLERADFQQCLSVFRDIKRIGNQELLQQAFKVRITRSTIQRLLNDYHNNPKEKYVNWQMKPKSFLGEDVCLKMLVLLDKVYNESLVPKQRDIPVSLQSKSFVLKSSRVYPSYKRKTKSPVLRDQLQSDSIARFSVFPVRGQNLRIKKRPLKEEKNISMNKLMGSETRFPMIGRVKKSLKVELPVMKECD